MLIGLKSLRGDAISASDGVMGAVDEILFDDHEWTVRYLVVDTGTWMPGRKVLISPSALGTVDSIRETLSVTLTRDEIAHSPVSESALPVSEQVLLNEEPDYGWPYFWGGNLGVMGGIGLPGGMILSNAILVGAVRPDLTPQEASRERAKRREALQQAQDAHLRSTEEVTGYAIIALDERLGHVDDFIFDDSTWQIRYVVVDTGDWWPGRKVLIPPGLIRSVNWPEGTVAVEISRNDIREAPEWDKREPIDQAFEDILSVYYSRRHTQRVSLKAESMRGRRGFAGRSH